MLRQLIHLPATSPYEPRHHLCTRPPCSVSPTAPPWRHAPRFFLAAALVANPPTNRDVPPQFSAKAVLSSRTAYRIHLSGTTGRRRSGTAGSRPSGTAGPAPVRYGRVRAPCYGSGAAPPHLSSTAKDAP
ncbi:hypothetical protein ACE1SV_34280 [Streptomyces sennicomposti]